MPSDPIRLREEIAQAAARMIAEDGADYATAKRKAARQMLGDARVAGEWLPDNEMIEDEVRAYQALFHGEHQPRILALMRQLALLAMDDLAAFRPYLVGAVLNGTATEHSGRLYTVLLRQPQGCGAAPAQCRRGFRHQRKPALCRPWGCRNAQLSVARPVAGTREPARSPASARHIGAPVGIHLALYDADDERGAARADATGRPARRPADAVRALATTNAGVSRPL
jgi:hypothetical protein